MRRLWNCLDTAVDRIAVLHPVIICCFLFGLGGCLLAHGTFLLRLTVMLLAIIWILASFVFRRYRFLSVLRSGAIGLCFGAAVSILLFNGYAAHLESFAGETVEIKGYVRETVYTTNYSGCYILQISDGLPWSRIVVETMDPDWEEGQSVSGRIALRSLEEGKDGAFDERTYYFGKSVVLAGEDIDCTPTGKMWYAPGVVLHKINAKLSSLFRAHIQGDGLASAVLLGNRDSLSDTAQRDFRRLGILHLLAVSGMHLAVLMVFSERVFISLRIRPWKRLVVQAILCVGYMALTGFSASVVRAGLMHLLLIVCKALSLKLKYFNALVLSCTVILLLSPFAVLDVSLHLSFLATCGCLIHIYLQTNWEPLKQFIYGKPKKRRELSPVQLVLRKIRREFCGVLVMTAIISLLMMPLSCLYFGEMSLLGFIMGIFYIPAISLLMYVSILYLLLYPIGIFILPLAKIISVYTSFLLGIASEISHLPHITLSLKYPFMPLFLIPLFLCVLFLPLIQRKGRWILCGAGVFCGMLITVGMFHLFIGQDVNVIYRNVNKNDGFVLQNGTKTVLADVSDGSYTFTGYLLHEAKSLYATELHGYWLTHYHERHVATLEKISDNWILRNLYLTAPQNEKEQGIYSSLVSCAQRKGIRVVLLDEDTQLFGKLTVQCTERTYLSRSSHPITAFSFAKDGTRLTYVSSSWNEGDGTLPGILADSQAVILGSHSPVYKKISDLTLVKPEWIVWNGDSAEWVRVYTDSPVPQLFGCGRMVYRFP